MSNEVSSTNVSFAYLKDSPEFLNLLLDNISSCILLLNKDMELQAFNDAMKTIFSNKTNEHLLYKRCGEAIGCAYVIEEEKQCGETSHCKFCELRTSALIAYSEKRSVFKEHIEREYYTAEDKKIKKHLQFSVRPFYHDKEYYILVIVDDVTKYYDQENIIIEQLKEIQQLKT